MRRRALVAGGSGFLGSHLCEALLGDGYDVICVDDLSTGDPRNIEQLAAGGDIELVREDIAELGAVPGHLDAVLHLASPASPADYLRLPVHTLRAGSLGTLRTLELAREKGARYLLTSTSEVYGDPLVHPQPESYWGHVNPIGPRSVYDESKRFAEALTVTYRGVYGVETSIARIFNTYGPRMRPDDGRMVPTFLDQALRSEPITVSGSGSQTRSLCYVSDLVRGLMMLLHSDVPGPVNLGNPEEYTVLRVAEAVREVCGSASPVEFVPRPVDDPERRRPDISLAKTLLGWSPEVPLDEGLKRTAAWFTDLGAGQGRERR
ncbi:UDP-glucuronic acid decarboxylase family protein [Streptomyces sp. WI04-05B]|uniref:UDP-glucuronic acid decarboxylase family protein n=1 Tax=Streptomyces TaxID=1883 RepID=UPI0029B8F23C|nr:MULTISPECIES: UDP-glucuronic acid decarboxylase family protein [unclassified Streptomyces]MDX2545371.1 SDR family oxidoreductase [Streptomyces sp. WI04-05B]MDX2588134.1 SDR family oxidoreductase [Streptomyces sp. WI04-05A]MDX3749105.1 SDR family oxidoreductase [Streptomyces sp. AK08-02]